MGTPRTIHSDRSHFGWDKSLAPAVSVEPGAELELEVIDSSGGQIARSSGVDAIAALDFERVNPVTGPIYVDGARPGDALAIEILDLSPGSWGWTAIIPGFGLLADDFAEPFLHISSYDAARVELTPEIALPTRPFIGTIGVAPAAPGHHSVVPPRNVGGNMDLRDVARGATLYLPVEVEGGLLSLGDTHAAQGDGEVCGTAIETAMNVRIRVGVVANAGIVRPQLDLPPSLAPRDGDAGYHVTTGIGPDLMDAARDAVRDMIDHLERVYRLDAPLAYCLCSVGVSLRISEIVDMPNWLVSAYLPKSIFR